MNSTDRGKVQCAGGSQDFDGTTSIILEAYQLTATCLVTIDDKRGVFQVANTGSTTCNLSGQEVVCTPTLVE
jgi:hypothetical protein